jgi:hypothetical protein
MGGFAVYRLPYAKQATLVRQTEGEPLELSSCQALNGQQGFVIAPFEITPAQPIILIRPDETECLDLSRSEDSFSRKEEGGPRKENSLEAGGNLLPRSSFLLPRITPRSRLRRGCRNMPSEASASGGQGPLEQQWPWRPFHRRRALRLPPGLAS